MCEVRKLSEIHVPQLSQIDILLIWYYIHIVWYICSYNIYYQMLHINLGSLRFLLLFIFVIWKRKRWRWYIWLSKSNIKLLFTKISDQMIIFDHLKVITRINHNFILLLLSQIYHLHLFLFQITKIKSNKKRSDPRLMCNIW